MKEKPDLPRRETLSEFLEKRRIRFGLRKRLITVKRSRDKEQFN